MESTDTHYSKVSLLKTEKSLDKKRPHNVGFALCGQKEFYWALGRKKSFVL
jgi:hypothetical protein